MDNLAQQIDEIEVLTSIYGNDWHTENIDNRSYSINIGDGEKAVKLYITLPNDYPSLASPLFELSAPYLSSKQKQNIFRLLEEVYLSCNGEIVLYQCIEKIREELETMKIGNFENVSKDPVVEEIVQLPMVISRVTNNNSCDLHKCPEIHHGKVIVDRKSAFQGHAAKVFSIDDVKMVLNILLEMKKIKEATHNIYAYRIYQDATKGIIYDCEDDGENQAGGRILHFLEIIDVKNVIVVVSRWYGGIHLGPDRFKHINNAARQVLEASNLISKHKDNKK